MSVKKKLYSEFWGGCIEINVVREVSKVPSSCRYCYSDDCYDIYECEDGTLYGVIQ